MGEATVSQEALTADRFPLFSRFPELAESLPRVTFSTGPSPVAHLRELGKRIGRDDIWIKNDGLYGTLYGGNKPRKLEFILADAVAKGAKTVLTIGAVGTNHGLATALYGAQLGLQVALLLTYEEPNESIARQLCWIQSAGAELHYTHSLPGTVMKTPYFILRYRSRDGRWPYLLAPGASTPLGALGYVNAALELAQQIKEGQLPEPRHILLPLGSGGTAAGLMLGLRVAGLRSRLVAVAVTRAPTTWPAVVAGLANASARLLAGKGVPRQGLPTVRTSDMRVVRKWLGSGFGKATQKGKQARLMLEETEGITLESTYTGKTMAALTDLCRDASLAGPVLYWHTYNALPTPQPTPTRDDYLRLPREFQRFCPAV